MEFESSNSCSEFFDSNMLSERDMFFGQLEDIDFLDYGDFITSDTCKDIKQEAPISPASSIAESLSPPPAVVPNDSCSYHMPASRGATIVYPEVVCTTANNLTQPVYVTTIGQHQPSPLGQNFSAVNVGTPQILSVQTLNKGTSNRSPVDTQAKKRQERMIKNRESASLSRKKKKEYVQKLEQDIKDLQTQNLKLRSENSYLKTKLREYLPDGNNNLFQKAFKEKKVLSFSLAMCCFFFCFNIYPNMMRNDGFIPPGNTQVIKSAGTGRSLLWEPDSNATVELPNSDYFLTNFTLSSMLVNRSEAARVENQIRCWLQQVERLTEKKQNQVIPKISSTLLAARPSWVKSRYMHQQRKIDKKASSNSKEFALQLYQSPRNNYEEFFDSIHRRNDTFYFVSFSGDHLLFPAMIHNKTGRPRISIVMPAMIFNETTDNLRNHVTMMQIDCEVLDTRYVYVKESALPPYFKDNASRETLMNYHLLKNQN